MIISVDYMSLSQMFQTADLKYLNRRKKSIKILTQFLSQPLNQPHNPVNTVTKSRRTAPQTFTHSLRMMNRITKSNRHKWKQRIILYKTIIWKNRVYKILKVSSKTDLTTEYPQLSNGCCIQMTKMKKLNKIRK